MRASAHLKICGYLLALLGLLAVTATEHFSSIWPPVVTGLVAVAWFFEGPRKHTAAYRRLWTVLNICMVAYFPLDMLLTANLLLPAVRVSMFIQAYLLLNPKSVKSYRWIYLVSFAQVLASTNLTSDMFFAIILTLYCLVAVYAIMLLYLLSGLRENERADTSVPAALLAVSLALTVLLVPAAFAFFYGAPRLRYALIASGRDVEAQRRFQMAKSRTGFTTTVRLGTFGEIQEDQTLALRVEIPPGSDAFKRIRRWRGGGLNIYDGTTWSSSRAYFPFYNGRQREAGNRNSGSLYPRDRTLFVMDARYAQYENTERLDADQRLENFVFYLEIPFTDTLFGAGDIMAVDGPFRYGLVRDFNKSIEIRNRPALPEFMSYSAYCDMSVPDARNLREVGEEQFTALLEDEEAGEFFRAHFLQLPPSLNPEIRRLAANIAKDAPTPYDKLLAIKNHLENRYTYSLDLGAPSSNDPLTHFLFVSRSGHCEYFATAMTLMARSIGIPARLAKGFQRGEWNESERYFEILQRDAHAWVEAYFPGYGWVEFDPSPREAANEYFNRRRSPIQRAFAKRFLALQILWRKHIVGYNETRRLRLFSQAKDFVFKEAPRRTAELLAALSAKVRGSASANPLGALLAVAAAIAAAAAIRNRALFSAFPWPVTRRRRAGGNCVFYEKMLSLLKKRRIVKPDSMTSLEFLREPAVRMHPLYGDIEAVTSIYNQVRFGGHPIAWEEARRINDALRNLKRAEKKSAASATSAA